MNCLAKGSTDVAELTEQIHELELENVQQAGDVRRLTEVNVEKDKRLYSHRPMLYALIAMCVILTMALIGYMISVSYTHLTLPTNSRV